MAKTKNNCTDTSSKQIVITNTSIESLLENSFVKVYPNPAKDYINIEIAESNYDGMLTLIDLTGKLVYKAIFNKQQIVPINDLNNGIYLVKIEVNNQIYYSKFIKN